MDINNLKGCIDHEEATIRSYMRDPDFANYMLQDAIAEGDMKEAQKIQQRIAEAEKRRNKIKPHWANVAAVL